MILTFWQDFPPKGELGQRENQRALRKLVNGQVVDVDVDVGDN